MVEGKDGCVWKGRVLDGKKDATQLRRSECQQRKGRAGVHGAPEE